MRVDRRCASPRSRDRPLDARAGATATGYRSLCACALTLLLGACATSPPEAPPISTEPESIPSETERWVAHREAVRSAATWEARGKVAYRLPDDSGSASLSWHQEGDDSELRLAGPLGAGATTIRNDGALIRVTRDGIERLYPADAAPWLPGGALLPIPVDAIRYWLRGVPDPTLPVDALELNNARIATLSQGGWLIRIDAYDESEEPPLPSRLRIEAPVAELSLRALIREWE